MFIIYDAGILIAILCFLAFAVFGGIVQFFDWIAENNILFIGCFLGIIMIKSLIIAFRGRNKYYSIYSFIACAIPYLPMAAYFIYVAKAGLSDNYGLFSLLFVIMGRVFILCLLAIMAGIPDMLIATDEKSDVPLQLHIRLQNAKEELHMSACMTTISTVILIVYILLCIYW